MTGTDEKMDLLEDKLRFFYDVRIERRAATVEPTLWTVSARGRGGIVVMETGNTLRYACERLVKAAEERHGVKFPPEPQP